MAADMMNTQKNKIKNIKKSLIKTPCKSTKTCHDILSVLKEELTGKFISVAYSI